MKILVVKPKAAIKMDSDVFCEGFERLGHIIIEPILEGNNVHLPNKNVDVIWCPYEQELPLGLAIKQSIDAPIVGHFEWMPPWRTATEDVTNWGYTTDEEIKKIRDQQKDHIDYYFKLLNLYLRCDRMTTPTRYCLSTIEKLHTFTPEDYAKIRIKPYIIDDRLLSRQKDSTIEEEYAILTIGRLVPHKKIDHIIEALSYIKNPPKLKILGYGPEKDNIIKLANKLNINIEFVGVGIDGGKALEIQKSKFLVTPFTSLPVGEAAIFKKPTILYNHPNVIQKHGNMGQYVATDDTTELADAIRRWLNYPEEARREGQNSYDKLMSNESGLKTTENACNEMIKIFKEVVK